MRILILSQYFHPEPDFKGMPLARHLAAQGHDVRVLTGYPNYPGGKLYPGYHLRPWHRELVEGIQVFRVVSYLSHNRNAVQRALSYISFAAAALLALAVLRFRPQAIYVYNLVTLIPVAVAARWRWGSRVVVDVQDLWPESVSASGMAGNGQMPHMLSALCDKAYQSADALVVQSPGFSRRLAQRGINPAKLNVIYNWALREYPRSQSSSTNDTRDFRIVYAGNVGTVQGLNVIIETAAILADSAPQVRFVIAGSGSDYDRIQAASAKLNNVELLGQLPPEILEPILRNASALLLHLIDDPLFHITIPSKLQQYFQVGRPVLCGVPGDASTLVREAQAGVTFPPGDAEALAGAIVQLLEMSPADRELLGQNASAYYSNHLTREQGLRRITSVLADGVA